MNPEGGAMKTLTITLPEAVPDMGGWTVRNLPAHPELAKASGGRAHHETPIAGSGFVHANANGTVNVVLTARPGTTGPDNPRLARMLLTPEDARAWAAALLAVVEQDS
jgi:hypothetical protein